MKIKKTSQSTFKKVLLKKHVDLLLIEKEGFYTLIYKQTSYQDRKRFYFYFLQSFSTAWILERYVNGFFEPNIKQMIKVAKKVQIVKFKN